MHKQKGKYDTDDKYSAAVEIHKMKAISTVRRHWMTAGSHRTNINALLPWVPVPVPFRKMAYINRIRRHPHRLRFKENVSEISPIFTNIFMVCELSTKE